MRLLKNSTAVEIREFLRKTQPNYVWALWHNLHVERKLIRMRYSSFCSYFRTLERLGLVLRSKSTKTEKRPGDTAYHGRLKPHYPRAYYVLNSHKLNSSAWLAPQRALHPETFLLTHRLKGRPPGSLNKPKETA